MDFTQFTPDQAVHAQKVADRLYRHRRFFLPKGTNLDNPLPYLPASVFSELYGLHQRQEDFYERLTLSAELAIREEEAKLGIAHHKLTDGQRLAQCNRFYGGLEIFAIIPLEPIAEVVENGIDNLAEELFNNWHHQTSVRAMSRRANFDSYVEALGGEMYRFFVSRPSEQMLVVLGTRFDGAHKNLLSERIGDLVSYPYITSFLMYKLGGDGTKLSPHMYTVFDKLGDNISMDFCPGHARITPAHNGKYEEKIAFATIL